MNEEHTSNWNELVSRWQSGGAPISAQDIRRHARRLHLQAVGIVIAEVVASLIGLSTAVWIASATTMLFVGVGFGLGILLFTLQVLSWQLRTHRPTDSAEDAISALAADVDREEATREMLRTGYGVVLAAMLAVVVAASSQLINFHGGAASQFLPLIASGAYLVGCMALAILLERRARRRAKVFRTLREHLVGDPALHKGVHSLVGSMDESGI